MKKLYIISLLIDFCFFGCVNNNLKTQHNLPVIDFEKKYPEKKIVFEDVNKEYVRLESTDEVLADDDFHVYYMSEKRICGVNRSRGDIFIFNRNGKIISHFNHKGNSATEYSSLLAIVFDEKENEIFVADNPSKNQCKVYSENGKFLRQFSFPDNSTISNLYDFDGENLLAYNDFYEFYTSMDAGDINQKMPYVFLSKKDGSISSRLDFTISNRISGRYTVKVNGSERPLIYPNLATLKKGRELFICDNNADTVFLLSTDKKMTPLFVRKPSAYEEKYVMYIHSKMDSCLFFNVLPLPTIHDWSGLFVPEGFSSEFPVALYAFDLHTKQFFSIDREFLSYNVDVSENCIARVITAAQLIGDYNNGKLSGKIHQLAQTINEDDNPVIEIIYTIISSD